MDITLLTTSLWTTLQPLLPLLAVKSVEEIGKQTGGALWNAIKQKFDTKTSAKEALADLLKNPDDQDLQAAFRVQLKKLLEEDAGFAGSMEQLLRAAGTHYAAKMDGDGAIAQGQDAKAVGKGGVMIGGNVSGSTIVAGNDNVVNKKD